jgi:O-methyltransferase/methyltransferase family protein
VPNLSSQDARKPNPGWQIMELGAGYRPAACIYITAKLKIADLLVSGPKQVSELASVNGVNEDALYRVLRAIASLGVFREVAPHRFENTPLSDTLRSDVPGSSRDAILFLSDPMHLRIFAELLHSVETGGTAFKKATGMEPFEFFQQNADENQAFNAAMTSISEQSVPPVIEAYDFGESGTLADIGGGHGILLSMILRKHKGLKGIVFDLPHVVEGAKARIESFGLASRCEIVGGDFFQAVPPADSYVMKSIIHDWDETRAITILKNCAKAMRNSSGKIILIEMLIAPGNEPNLAKWLDLEMLAMAGGRERTEAEYAELFAKAGLRLSRVVRSQSPFGAIEAVKI